MNVFNEIDKFFSSLKNFVDLNEIFLIFVGLFLFTIVVVIVSTTRSYEARLIKAIDMLNNYFIDNPQINEDNLVQFNAKMKSKKVPKQLRKQWQQYVLYREKKASEYMSFDACVSIPIRNSTYKRDLGVMTAISWILAILSFVVNMYIVLNIDIAVVLRQSFLTPSIIILINIIVRIFLDMRHNAIISDLNQNYQYFEVNIDKATNTLPEYVDYEVLFDKNEIKRGIPMLYAYLQMRAEMEKKELERARLKNVHHEKFNFDEAGVESSLVLERAMQEAENYISERKKLMQDMEQINGDITQEEMNFREVTKEYQRQMQISKETFDNFKAQLDEASSTIEINYLKKQQQQELDRQRNLERDYDIATDKHKKVLNSYQEELTTIETEIKKARQTLERGMLSEFESYSGKVYDEAYRIVEEREKSKTDKLKSTIKQLEERIVAKDAEMEDIYKQNQNISNQLNNQQANMTQDTMQDYSYESNEYTNPQNEYDYTYDAENTELNDSNEQASYNYTDDTQDFDYTSETSDSEYDTSDDKAQDNFDYTEDLDFEDKDEITDNVESADSADDDQGEEIKPDLNDAENGEDLDSANDLDFTDQNDESEHERNVDESRNIVTEEIPKRKAGRPRKERPEENQEARRGRGRPKKSEQDDANNDEIVEIKRGRGRPKKTTVAKESSTQKKGRGRPKKVENKMENVSKPKKGRGRPKKEVSEKVAIGVKKGRGRPKKVENKIEKINTEPKRGRGRPKKTIELDDLDAYIQELDKEIEKENAKIAESKDAIEKNSNISKK